MLQDPPQRVLRRSPTRPTWALRGGHGERLLCDRAPASQARARKAHGGAEHFLAQTVKIY